MPRTTQPYLTVVTIERRDNLGIVEDITPTCLFLVVWCYDVATCLTVDVLNGVLKPYIAIAVDIVNRTLEA
jgi:hypothetical protein